MCLKLNFWFRTFILATVSLRFSQVSTNKLVVSIKMGMQYGHPREFNQRKYWKRLSTMIKTHTGTFPEQFCCRIMIVLHCSYDLPPVSFSYLHLGLFHVHRHTLEQTSWPSACILRLDRPSYINLTQSPVTFKLAWMLKKYHSICFNRMFCLLVPQVFLLPITNGSSNR